MALLYEVGRSPDEKENAGTKVRGTVLLFALGPTAT